MRVDFIICNNSDLWLSECEKYIENLIVPDDVEVSVLGITEVSGMAEGYEQGRNASTADYKVYLHQDVFIVNRHFIEDIDAVFRIDDRIGIIGMLGNDEVRDQRLSWDKWKYGKVIAGNGREQMLVEYGEIRGQYHAVDCLDGMVLVTRYDIPWREDIFTDWHFYDRSICLEYKRRGYICVVPRQEMPWCVHACGVGGLAGWSDSLRVYLDEYRDFFQADKVLENSSLPDGEALQRADLAADKLEELIDRREMDGALKLMDEAVRSDAIEMNKRLVFAEGLLEIWKRGEYRLFFAAGDSVSEMRLKYVRAFFLLQRKCYGLFLDAEETGFLSGLAGREKAVIMRRELTLHDQAGRDVGQVAEILVQIAQKAGALLKTLSEDQNADVEREALVAVSLGVMLDAVEYMIPASVYEKYSEFFAAFCVRCKQCGDEAFLSENKREFISSLKLFIECMKELVHGYTSQIRKCPYCGKRVIYQPLLNCYKVMAARYRSAAQGKGGIRNEEEYSCPNCGAGDSDKLIVSFLAKEGLQEAAEGLKLLHIAPASAVSGWINRKCPHIQYDTMDPYTEQETFHFDIMDMHMISDETYDVIICSHVPEDVRDDRKALGEWKRVLKPEGKVILFVPTDINTTCIDEKRGTSGAENLRASVQADYCRSYGKNGLAERLEEHFYVHSLGKEYFGEELLAQCGLTDTSTLYVLAKSREVSLSMAEEIVIDERLCKEGPLVSVVMSCYNHGAFVADAIESVIGQSYKNIEFLVADDGSSDDSAGIMQRYSEHFAEEHYFTDNFGERFSFLWERSHGKYIAIINSDDVWEKDKLYFQVKYMEEHQDCGACFTWTKYADENLAEFEDDTFRQRNRSGSEWMRFFWQNGNTLCHPSSLMRREFRIEPPRYANSCWQLWDMFKWVDMLQNSSIYIIPKFLTVMRRYDRNGIRNVSAYTPDNVRRHHLEEGHNWFWSIRNMENAFFKDAFGEFMVNPLASTEQEIKCEKYFLLLSHPNPYTRNGAISYLFEIFNEVEVCMQEKYGYTKKMIKDDILRKGDPCAEYAGRL